MVHSTIKAFFNNDLMYNVSKKSDFLYIIKDIRKKPNLYLHIQDNVLILSTSEDITFEHIYDVCDYKTHKDVTAFLILNFGCITVLDTIKNVIENYDLYYKFSIYYNKQGKVNYKFSFGNYSIKFNPERQCVFIKDEKKNTLLKTYNNIYFLLAITKPLERQLHSLLKETLEAQKS